MPAFASSAGWPSGHLCWAFDGPAHFQAGASTFLAEGDQRGERLLFVVDNPVPGRWPSQLLASGALRVCRTVELYGEDLVVDPARQRSTFADALASALEDGYMGLRVAADSTSLVSSPEALAAWAKWEETADLFMQENPFTGLCAFDQQRLEPEILSFLVSLHSISVER